MQKGKNSAKSSLRRRSKSLLRKCLLCPCCSHPSSAGSKFVNEQRHVLLLSTTAQTSPPRSHSTNMVVVATENQPPPHSFLESFHNDCIRRSTKVNSLLTELSNVKRAQNEFIFDFNSSDGVTSAKEEFKIMRNQLGRYSDQINENLSEIDRLCVEGVETLTPDQFHQLKDQRQRLLATYEDLIRRADGVLERLDIAAALLIEFSTKTSIFQSWALEKSREIDRLRAQSGDPADLNESRKKFKLLDEEIRTKKSDLAEICQLATKIELEICKYIDEIRNKEDQTIRFDLQYQQVTEAAKRVQSDYSAILDSKNELSQLLKRLAACSRQYEQDLADASDWLTDLERHISHALISSPNESETRLTNLTSINQMSIENQQKIDSLIESALLLAQVTAATDAHDGLKLEQDNQIAGIQKRHRTLSNRIRDSIDGTRAEITRREGLLVGLANLNEWLMKTEVTIVPRELPLNVAKLNDLKYEDQINISELDSKQKTLDELDSILSKMHQNASKTQNNNGIQAEFFETTQRFQRLNVAFRSIHQNLLDVIAEFEQFQKKSQDLSDKLSDLHDEISVFDAANINETERAQTKIASIVDEDWVVLKQTVQRLLQIPNVMQTDCVTERMRSLENIIQKTKQLLASRLSILQSLNENRQKFSKKAIFIETKLSDVEYQLSRLDSVAKSSNTNETKRDEFDTCNCLKKELEALGADMEEISRLSDSLIQCLGNGGLNSSSAIVKRTPGDSDSTDNRATEIGRITKELFDLHRRYDNNVRNVNHLREKITQKNINLDDWMTERNNFLGSLTSQNATLQRIKNELKFSMPVLGDLAQELVGVAQTHREQQMQLMTLQIKCNQLVGQNDESEAAEMCKALFEDWRQLEENRCRLANCVGTAQNLLSEEQFLLNWLNAKSKVLNSCLVSADAKMLEGQAKIVRILSEEQHSEMSRWQKMNNNAGEVVRLADDSKLICDQIVERVDSLNLSWKKLENDLFQRQRKLEEAKKYAFELDKLNADIFRDLNTIENKITSTAGMEQKQQTQCLLAAEGLLDELKPSLEALNSQAEKLEALIEDPSHRSDLVENLNKTNRAVESLRLKLESIKKALTNAVEKEGELNLALNELIDWCSAQQANIAELSSISSNMDRLNEQIEEFKLPHSEIQAKEGEILIIGRRAAEAANKSPSNSAPLQQKLADLNQQWTALLSVAKTRQDALSKMKGILDELILLENHIQTNLALLNAELQAATRDKSHATYLATLETIKTKLACLSPNIDNSFSLVDKMGSVVTNTDHRKCKLRLQGYHTEHQLLSAEIERQMEQLKAKKDLWEHFESEVLTANKQLETVKSWINSDSLPKESFKHEVNEFEVKWPKLFDTLNNTAEKLKQLEGTDGISKINAKLDLINEKYKDLKQKIESKFADFKQTDSHVEKTLSTGQHLCTGIGDLIAKVTSLEPIARENDVLEVQLRNCSEMDAQVETNIKEIDKLIAEWDKICADKMCPSAQARSEQGEMEANRRVLERSKNELKQRASKIEETLKQMNALGKEVVEIHDEFTATIGQQVLEQPIGQEIAVLRSQQETLKSLRNKELRQLSMRQERATNLCSELIKSAEPNVTTHTLEKWLNDLSSSWDQLLSRVEERERQLDTIVQGFGSFNDAFNSLLNWLDETEEFFNRQKSPSADPKVLKAHIQMHEFQAKLANSKLSSIEGFRQMAKRLDPANDSQKEYVNTSVIEIDSRYVALCQTIANQQQQFQTMLELSKEWQSLELSLRKFLEETERQMHVFDTIPTDAQRLEEQINQQSSLRAQFDAKRDDFDRLVELFSEIRPLISAEDAQDLESSLRQLTGRYNEMGAKCSKYGELIAVLAEDIKIFLQSTNQLAEWLDEAEKEMELYNEVGTLPEELDQQSEELSNFVIDVAEQSELVSDVVKISRQLCAHTTGSEALSLQHNTDQLHKRYDRLTNEAELKIDILSKATPLSEEFHESIFEITEHLDGVEEDLLNLDQVSLEEQFQLVNTIEANLATSRTRLEAIQAVSVRLQKLTSESKAEKLLQQTNELFQRFNFVSENVNRQVDKLKHAELQSKHTFGVLDFWIGYFTDAQAQIQNADKPAVDIEQLKKLLKAHRVLNNEITNERNGLRNIITDAARVAREIDNSLDGQQKGTLMAKIQRAKALADSAAELSLERLTILEQAFALSQELDESYTELNDWMDGIEKELIECPPITTGMDQKLLLQQQQHNNTMLHQIQNQKSMTSKFERNVAAFGEICSELDLKNLQKIANEVLERFNDLEAAFRGRGEALVSLIDQSLQLGDRLNVFLSILEMALGKLRSQETPSCRPPVLQKQLAEASSIAEMLRQKEALYAELRQNAQKFIQSKSDSPSDSLNEVAQKSTAMENLWACLIAEINARKLLLNSVLESAEQFWLEYEQAQNDIYALRQSLASIDSNDLQNEQHESLQQLSLLQSQSVPACSNIIQRTCQFGTRLCDFLGAEDEQQFVQQHLVMLNTQWSALIADYSRLFEQMTQIASKLAQFNTLLQKLSDFIDEVEVRFAGLPQTNPLDVEEISSQVENVNSIRQELDGGVVLREQLAQLGAEICATPGYATSQTQNTVRRPLSEMNQRWNRISSSLAERQQQLRQSLLDTGHFTQACEQLNAWIDQTKATFGEINLNPKSLKDIEIELCRFRVVQNDIGAHLPGLEAIQMAGKSQSSTDPNSSQSTQTLLDNLNERWSELVNLAKQIETQLETEKSEMHNRGGDLDKWLMWLANLISELKTQHRTGGLPETAIAQLDEFSIMQADVEQNRPKLEAEFHRLEEYFKNMDQTSLVPDTWLGKQFKQARDDWILVQEKLMEREQKLQKALEDAIELYNGMQDHQEWLQEAERHLAVTPVVSKLLEPLGKQLAAHSMFVESVHLNLAKMKELYSKGGRIQLICEKKDAIPIKNKLVNLKHRTDKLSQRSDERLRLLERSYAETKFFADSMDDILRWAEAKLQLLHKEKPVELTTGVRIRESLEECKTLQMEISRRFGAYDMTCKKGEALEEHAPPDEKKQLSDQLQTLKHRWDDLNKLALKRQRCSEEALVQSGHFDDILAELLAWLQAKLPKIESECKSENSLGDLETVQMMLKEHYHIKDELETKRPNVQAIKERVKKMLSTSGLNTEDSSDIQEKLARLNEEWRRMDEALVTREGQLTVALNKAVDLDEQQHDLRSFIQDIESRIRRVTIPGELSQTMSEQEQLDGVLKDVDEKTPEFERTLEFAKHIDSRAHSRAKTSMSHLISALSSSWELLKQLISDKNDKLKTRLREIHAHEEKVSELEDYIGDRRSQFELMLESSDNNKIEVYKILTSEHNLFKSELYSRQQEFDEVERVLKKHIPPPLLLPIAQMDESMTYSRHSLVSSTKKLSNNSKSKIGDSTLAKSPRQQRTDALLSSWQQLLNDVKKRDEWLIERELHLQELERLKSFTFDDWRERYLRWNDHGKARISDLFRRIDKSGTGSVPRQLFIDGVLVSKFPTTALEMSRVADEFDKGDGMISSREFMNALRFDPKKLRREHKTDTERIHEEIARETARCTCAHRFPIQHIASENNRVHYGFGYGGAMKRMVRILRSTVMVRVGGGWESLENFLVKHDPCRAKGRLNVDIYDESLAPTARWVDQMETFTVRRSAADQSSETSSQPISPIRQQSLDVVERLLGYSPGSPGPVTKIREKTNRSVPMYKTPVLPKLSNENGGGEENSETSSLFFSPHILSESKSTSGKRRRGNSPSRSGSQSMIPKPTTTRSTSSSLASEGSSINSNGVSAQHQQQKAVRIASGRNTPASSAS